MFRFFRKSAAKAESGASPEPAQATETHNGGPSPTWREKLSLGLRKTKQSVVQVFVGTQIDDELYENLEASLLMADAGVSATQAILDQLRDRVKAERAQSVDAVKGLLEQVLTDWLLPLQQPLVIGRVPTTVLMVAGVNGAGKTTTIGKLTRHLSDQGAKVLLAAADTFRAAAREQLLTWADRNAVEIVSQADGDPAAVSFDAVTAGKARSCDVVLIDTAGRLPTQLHLMDELKKVQRVIQKADAAAPHETILVLDGHMGQNALSQAKAFDQALGLTGLVLTKLDGTAKGGILAAIAQWGRERQQRGESVIPVYFVGVGEGLTDLQTFDAHEFAQALLSE